jgi:tRNA1Val (adenine37-N6)-methyltransferase
MPNDFFRFKQFTIHQDRCAMKVSTDACLLGAWAPFPEPTATILDIGAGTGLLSLMLAQRFPQARITAVELDGEAAAQAAQNSTESPFTGRVQVVCEDIRTYQPDECFDAIICNPPFFSNSLKGPSAVRNQARHQDALHLSELSAQVQRLLKPNGYVAVVLPADIHRTWEELLSGPDWQLEQEVAIRPLPQKPVNRVLSLYRNQKSPEAVGLRTEEMLYESYGVYTPFTEALLQPFYLKL